jgi:hypothetical protein
VLGTHFAFTLTRADAEARKGEIWIGGDQQPVAEQPVYGTITAIRPGTGKIVWQRKTGRLWSGALVTAGGLLFVGETDGWLRAYDARTGRLAWEFFCGAGVNAPAICFELDGEQFIAVVAAGSRYSDSRGSALLVFGAPDERASAGRSAARDERPRSPNASASKAEGPVVWPPASATHAGPYLGYSSAERIAWISVDADSRAMTFNGAANGAQTFVVPLGWKVEIRVRNRDAAPHSARVVSALSTLPLDLPSATFGGAETANPAIGLAPGQTGTFQFLAARAGSFLIACAVPGHAAGGMYLRLVVKADAGSPSYQLANRKAP